MAKRFTDTSKWAKGSFSELSSKMKLVWIYLCDNCDHAGIWDINLGLLSYQVGEKVGLGEILESFGDKIELCGPTKVFLPSFVEFQYGTLNPNNKVHLSVLSRLEKLAPCKPLASPLQGAKDKDKEKEKDKDKEKEKENREKIKTEVFQKLQEIYENYYPRKIGKTKGLEKLVKEVSLEEVPNFNKAVFNYVAECKRQETPQNFIKHFSTFATEWKDWIEFNPPLEVVNQRPQANGDWVNLANRIWNLCATLGYSLSEKMRAELGPEVVELIKASGNLYELRSQKRDDYALKAFAARLKAAHELKTPSQEAG
jgi:hypothetical protein